MNNNKLYFATSTTMNVTSFSLTNEVDQKFCQLVASLLRYMVDVALIISSIKAADFNCSWPNLVLRLGISKDTLGNMGTFTPKNYVLSPENVSDIENLLYFLYHRELWNPRAKVLTIFRHDLNRTLAFEIFTRWGAANAILLIISQSSIEIYSRRLYSAKSKCTGMDNFLLANVSTLNNTVNLDKYLYTSEIFKNLNTCPVKVSTMDEPPYVFSRRTENGVYYHEGFDIRTLKTIVAKINASVMFMPEDPVYGRGSLVNGTWTGMLGEVMGGRSDIAIGALLLVSERCRVLDAVYPHTKDGLTWVVRRAKKRAHWKSLYLALPLSAWLLIAVAYLLVTVLMSTGKSPTTAWYYITGGCSPNLPRGSSRIFIIHLICAFLLASAYKSYMISMLIDPGYEHQVKSLQELVRRKTKFGFQAVMRFFLVDGEDNVLPEVVNNHRVSISTPELLKWVVEDGFAILTSKLVSLYYQFNQFLDENSRPLTYVFESNFMSCDSCMYMTMGHPLLQTFSHWVVRIADSGLMPKWKRDIEFTAKLQFSYRCSGNLREQFVVQLSHLQGAFAFLFLGLCIATAAMAAEIILYRKAQTLPINGFLHRRATL